MQRAIVFDVDDTLYDQLVPFQKAMETVFPEATAKYDDYFLYIEFRKVSDEVFPYFTSGEWSLEKMRYERINHTIINLGFSPISEEQATRFQDEYNHELTNIKIHQAMLPVLDYLVAEPVTLGVITNGPTKHQGNKIQQLKIEKWIPQEKIFISESTGYKKPDVEIFQLVEKQLQINPAQTLYVGDSFENDVEGAKAAGWQSLWVNHRLREIPDEATKQSDLTVTSFEDVLPAIKDWLK